MNKKSNQKPQQKKLSTGAKARARLATARAGFAGTGENVGFKNYLGLKEANKFFGMTPQSIAESLLTPDGAIDMAPVRKIVREANFRSKGQPQLNEMRLALEKSRKFITSKVTDADLRGKMSLLSDADFRKLLDVDDPYSDDSEDYDDQLIVSQIFQKMADYGYKSIHNLMLSSSPLHKHEFTTLGLSGSDDVNLDWIFGGISASVPCEPSPDDIPNLIFCNDFVQEYTLVANVLGSAGFVLKPENLAYTGSAVDTSYIAYNVAAAFDSFTGIGGTWNAVISAVATPGEPLFTKVKSTGFEIEVVPITSALNSKGKYVVVSTTTPVNESSYPTTIAIGIAAIGRIPWSRTMDMRSPCASRLFEESVYKNVDSGSSNPENFFIVLMQGCEAGASINIRITQKYAAQVSDQGMSIVKGRMPRLGVYSQKFKDFLRVYYPGITTWNSCDVEKLYRQLKGVGTNYGELVSYVQRKN